MDRDRPSNHSRQSLGRAVGLRSRWIAALPLLILALATPGWADAPEVVRVHVPAKKVADWFPAGEPLRLLTPGEFDALLKAADEGARERDRGGPRLIRARHSARFSSGLLRGSSELVVIGSPGERSALSLEPWSPAILADAAESGATVGASVTGETVLWLEPATEPTPERTIKLEWELRARPGSRGRDFALDLPGDATSILTLDAPRGWEPSGPSGQRLGPPPGDDADRETWRFLGRVGRLGLRFVNLSEKRDSENPPHFWVSGPTRIDLRADDDSAPTPVNWTTEWTVQADAPELREFSATLDPGLELLGVDGPNVQAFRLDPDPATRRVTVVLAGSAQSSSVVRFQARAPIPTEGTWSAPAIHPERPVVWTGGTTTIVLDDRLVVRDCRERDGRRVPPRSSDPAAATELVFESVASGSAAELTFRPAGARVTHVARGRLFVEAASTRLECDLIGLGKPGSMAEHDIEIPPGWAVDGVEIGGTDEGVSWNRSDRADGGAVLRVLVPPSDDAPEGRVLSLRATSSATPGDGPLALPRVRLSKGIVADEVWVAFVDDQTRLLPISTSGLAWIDPAETPGSAPPSPPAGFKPALAWRWTAESAEAVVDRQRVEADRQGWVYVKARIGESGRRLILEGRITVAADRGERPAPVIWIDPPAKGLESWSFVDAETGAKIEPTILDEPARRRLALPRSGAALEMEVEPSAAGRAVVDFRAKLPWSGRGRIPLPCLPGSFSPRGVVVIETPHRTRSRIETEGLRGIEPALAERLAPAPETWSRKFPASSPGSAAPYWTAHALTYSDAGCRLDLTTEELTPAEAPGLIRRARLTTQAFADGRSLNRLRLLVAAGPSGPLRLRSPAGLELVRIRIDGRDVAPIVEGDRVELPAQGDASNRDRVIEMDYRSAADPSAAPRRIRPTAPDLGLPCVSFDWELILPEGRDLDRPGPGLVLGSTPPRESWPFGALNFPNPGWPGQQASARPPRAEVVRWLDAQLEGAGPDGLSFAEWFTHWDSGAHPVIIDRAALSDAGLGPRSRCEPAQRDPKGLAASTRTLRQYGLIPLIVDDALVITTQREAAALDAATSWRSQISEALFWGGDKTDRFQSAARWRGEPSLDETTTSGEADFRPLPGFRSWRFSAAGWPGADAMVETSSASARALSGWLALTVVVLLAGSSRGGSSRRDLIVPLLLMALAVVLRTWAPALSAEGLAGLFVGALAILLARLGGLSRAALAGPAPSPSRRRFGPRFTALGIATALLIPSSVRAVGDGEKPIIALIPHDEPLDPAAPPARIILREEDHRRLQEFAHPRDGSDNPEPMITEAQHRVVRSANQEVVVTSEYALKTDRGSAAFVFPVSGARDIQATINDEAVPVAIAPGGESGVVALPAERSVRLRLRRAATPTRDDPTEFLSLKINPSPRARLTLDQAPEGRPVQQIGGRGGVVAKGNQTIEAELGPVDRIEIGWAAADPVADQPGATVESLILWDLDPAGERVRARLTYRPRRRISTIRIALEPGLLPRSIQVPGLVDTTWGGTPQNPEWIARVDPPIQDRTTIAVEFWRPLQGGSAEPAEAGTPPGAIQRRFPRVEPLGVDLGPGLLAVRRPGHWTGRLESPPDAEPVGDESFVRAWGPLPDEPLTFAGTVRFNHRDAVEFATGPAPTRWRLKPTTRLRIDSGRIDCRIEAELSEIAGLLDHVDLELPDDLVVGGVESEDVTDWSRPPGEPLQVRFDRIDLKSRRAFTIQGWIPVSRPSPTTGPRRLRARLPWVGAAAPAVVQPGMLIIASREPVELTSAEGGAAALAAGELEPGGGEEETPPGWTRLAYRIDDPTKVGELRWAPPHARVNVRIDSQVTIHPDSAEWVAVLRYDVIGDELDAVHLKVPAAWAARARLQLTGRDYQLTTESRDQSTFWSLTPERPIWGSQRLVLRSSLPLASEQQLEFPEIAPLGKGIVDCNLGVVFATAAPPTIEGTAGLRPIAHASRFQDAAFGNAAGMATRAFRVERDGWSLKVQAPPHGAAESAASGDQTADVENADLSLAMAADGSVLGRAIYQIKPHSGRFLVVAPSTGAALARATVDGAAVTPLLAEGGRWTIPLGEPAGSLVNLVWTEPPQAPDVADAPRSLVPPRAGRSAAPSVVTIHLPPDARIRPSPSGLETAGPERLDLERAGWVGRRITELLAEMDRASGRDRQRLTSLLIEHELALRSAERALRALARSMDRARRDQAARELELAQTSRSSMDEAVRSAGLNEQIEAARVYLGLDQRVEDSEGPGIPEPGNTERIRRIGQPTFLIGATPGMQSPPARVEVLLENAPRAPENAEARARALLLLVFLLSLVVASPYAARQARALWLMIAAGLALTAIAAGPIALVAAAATVLVGWRLRLGGEPRRAAA